MWFYGSVAVIMIILLLRHHWNVHKYILIYSIVNDKANICVTIVSFVQFQKVQGFKFRQDWGPEPQFLMQDYWNFIYLGPGPTRLDIYSKLGTITLFWWTFHSGCKRSSGRFTLESKFEPLKCVLKGMLWKWVMPASKSLTPTNESMIT